MTRPRCVVALGLALLIATSVRPQRFSPDGRGSPIRKLASVTAAEPPLHRPLYSSDHRSDQASGQCGAGEW